MILLREFNKKTISKQYLTTYLVYFIVHVVSFREQLKLFD